MFLPKLFFPSPSAFDTLLHGSASADPLGRKRSFLFACPPVPEPDSGRPGRRRSGRPGMICPFSHEGDLQDYLIISLERYQIDCLLQTESAKKR